MSGRYELPSRRDEGDAAPANPEVSGSLSADSASMWESLSRGADPTEERARSS
jgi:hypothetical protein